jgi:hypothetical protein
MRSLDVSKLDDVHRPSGVWAAALLHAIARDEAAGRRRPRLTERNLDTWTRFRGRLGSRDLLSLLFEDAAVLHRMPFDAAQVDETLHVDGLPEDLVDGWLGTINALPLRAAGPDYVLEQAALLGLPSRMAKSELHVVKPHQKVLELPGTGGQLAHHIASSQRDLTLQDNFVVACGSWQELTLAGLVALELGAPHTEFVTPAAASELKSPGHRLRQRSFDFVVGLHPDKGGLLHVEEQLAIWFPTAKILLV